MRKKGDYNEFKTSRDNEVRRAFRQVMTLYGGKVNVHTLYLLTSAAPASRFFVSARQAFRVISHINAGGSIASMRDTNRRMYSEIYRRVSLLMTNAPALSLRDAVENVVRQPAPEMYMGTRQISYVCRKEVRQCVIARLSGQR